MKSFFSICVLSLVAFLLKAQGPIKELTWDWNSPAIFWGNKAGYVPCLEPFNLKISNIPEKVTKVTVSLFESLGPNGASLQMGAIMGTYSSSGKTNGTFIVTLPVNLRFHRFYYFQVSLEDGTTSPPITAYSSPPKSETSTLEFFGSLGMANFSQSGLFTELSVNAMFATGLKFKFRPVSTNANIGRFGLYPCASKWSFVFAAVINDLSYKKSNIESFIFGIKPLIGFDYEFSENLGIFAGAVVGKQNIASSLNSDKQTVIGWSVGLTFSANVFKTFRSNVPATVNFPSIDNK